MSGLLFGDAAKGLLIALYIHSEDPVNVFGMSWAGYYASGQDGGGFGGEEKVKDELTLGVLDDRDVGIMAKNLFKRHANGY